MQPLLISEFGIRIQLVLLLEFKIPNLYISFKKKNSKYVWIIAYWNLRFICNLVLGIWDLSFGLSLFGRVPGFGRRIADYGTHFASLTI